MSVIEKRTKHLEDLKRIITANKDISILTDTEKHTLTYGKQNDYIEEIEDIQGERKTYSQTEILELRAMYEEINNILNTIPIYSGFKLFCCYINKQPSTERKQIALDLLESFNEQQLNKTTKYRGNTEFILKHRHARQDKLVLEDAKNTEAGKLIQSILDKKE